MRRTRRGGLLVLLAVSVLGSNVPCGPGSAAAPSEARFAAATAPSGEAVPPDAWCGPPPPRAWLSPACPCGCDHPGPQARPGAAAPLGPPPPGAQRMAAVPPPPPQEPSLHAEKGVPDLPDPVPLSHRPA